MVDQNVLAFVEEEMRKCMKCGNCQAVCPVYKETKTEASVARGKIQLAAAVLKGELELTPEFGDKMFKCLLCKTCMSLCPCGVQVDKVVMAAREEIARKKGLHPLKKVIFRVLKNPAIFDLGLTAGSHFQGLLFKKSPVGKGNSPRFPVGLDMKRVIPGIKRQSLKNRFKEVVPAATGSVTPKLDGRKIKRVAFYTGCTINHMFTDVGKSVVEVLTRNGLEVVIPKKQHCCGTPVFAHGDTKTAREMAISNISVFEAASVDAVIIACGTCTSAWKHYFPDWLKGTPEYDRAVQMDKKTFEITDFLMKLEGFNNNLGKVNMKVTYHDSCHLTRELGIRNQPRELIRKIPGVELIEMKHPDRCCGGAGSFSLMYYDISLGILEKKMNDAKATGADYIMTGCSGCRMQLIDGIARFNADAGILHPIQALDMAYKAWDKENSDATQKSLKAAVG